MLKKNEKENNKKYNKKKITKINYFINNDGKIKIFGNIFVKNNRKNCRLIINNKEKKLKEYEILNKIKENNKINIKKIKKIKIKIYDNLLNIEKMFEECKSIKIINKINISYVRNMSKIFYGCTSLKSLPDISKWNTNNVIDMRGIF